MQTVISGILPWLAGINAITFILSFTDKWTVVRGKRRVVSSRLLLWLSFLGGSLGARLGQIVFHHKILDREFSNTLTLICLLHAVILVNVFVLIKVDRTTFISTVIAPEPEKDTGPVRFGPGT